LLASNICAAAVSMFFLVSPVIVAASLRRWPLTGSKKRVFVAAIAVGLAGRIALAAAGHNYDLESWQLVAGLCSEGKSVYASTTRYNYGPIWAWVVSGLMQLAGLLRVGPGEGFHILVAAFLGTVDVLVSVVVVSGYSYTAGLVFLLAPIGFLVSGYHSQFDNLALLVALLGWRLVRGDHPGLARLMSSAVLIGLSLVVKHILLFFPIWLLFRPSLGPVRRRIAYVALAYACFAASFAPWLFDGASRAGIVANVLLRERYGGTVGYSILGLTTEIFVPIKSFNALLDWLPMGGGFQSVWAALMVVIGLIIARRSAQDLLLMYLALLYALTPTIFDQYMAIALVPCAVFYRCWASWAFLASGTAALLTSSTNVLSFLHCATPAFTFGGRAISVGDLLRAAGHAPMILGSQVCVLVLLVLLLHRPGVPVLGAERTPRAQLIKATGLAAAGWTYGFLVFAKQVWSLYMAHKYTPGGPLP
jgi:hypothetical protein